MISSADAAAVVALVIEADAGVARSPLGLDLRAGVASGPAIMFEGDDYIGRPVNVAARLCSAAAPRQILASEDAVAGVPPWVSRNSATKMAVRGFDLPLNVSSLAIRSGSKVVADPVCGLSIPLDSAVSLPQSEGARPMFCSRACMQGFLDRTRSVSASRSG